MLNHSSSNSNSPRTPRSDATPIIDSFFVEFIKKIDEEGFNKNEIDLDKIQRAWRFYETSYLLAHKNSQSTFNELTDKFFSNTPRELPSPYTHFEASLAAFFVNLFDILLYQKLNICPRIYSRATEWLGKVNYITNPNENKLTVEPFNDDPDLEDEKPESFESVVLKNELTLENSEFNVFEKYAQPDAEFNKYTIAEGALVFLDQFQRNMSKVLENEEFSTTLKVIKPSLVIIKLYEMSVHYLGSYIQEKIKNTLKFSGIFLPVLDKLTIDFSVPDGELPSDVLNLFFNHVKKNISLGVIPAITKEQREKQERMYTRGVNARDMAQRDRNLMLNSSAMDLNQNRYSLLPGNYSISVGNVKDLLGSSLDGCEPSEYEDDLPYSPYENNTYDIGSPVSSDSSLSPSEKLDVDQYIAIIFGDNLPYLRKLDIERLAKINPNNPNEFYQMALHRLYDAYVENPHIMEKHVLGKITAEKLKEVRASVTPDNFQILELIEEENIKNEEFSAQLKAVAASKESAETLNDNFEKALEAVAIAWTYPEIFNVFAENQASKKEEFGKLYAEDKMTRLRIAVEWMQENPDFIQAIPDYFHLEKEKEGEVKRNSDELLKTSNPACRVQMMRVFIPLFLQQQTEDVASIGRMFNRENFKIDEILFPHKALNLFENLEKKINSIQGKLEDVLVSLLQEAMLAMLADFQEIFQNPNMFDDYNNFHDKRNTVIAQTLGSFTAFLFLRFAKQHTVFAQFSNVLCTTLSKCFSNLSNQISQNDDYYAQLKKAINNREALYISTEIQDGFSFTSMALEAIANGQAHGARNTIEDLFALREKISEKELVSTIANFWLNDVQAVANKTLFSFEHVSVVLEKDANLLWPIVDAVITSSESLHKKTEIKKILSILFEGLYKHSVSNFESLVFKIADKAAKSPYSCEILRDSCQAFSVILAKHAHDEGVCRNWLDIFPNEDAGSREYDLFQKFLAKQLSGFKDRYNISGAETMIYLLSKKIDIRDKLKHIVTINSTILNRNVFKKMGRRLGYRQDLTNFFSWLQDISNASSEEFQVMEKNSNYEDLLSGLKSPTNTDYSDILSETPSITVNSYEAEDIRKIISEDFKLSLSVYDVSQEEIKQSLEHHPVFDDTSFAEKFFVAESDENNNKDSVIEAIKSVGVYARAGQVGEGFINERLNSTELQSLSSDGIKVLKVSAWIILLRHLQEEQQRHEVICKITESLNELNDQELIDFWREYLVYQDAAKEAIEEWKRIEKKSSPEYSPALKLLRDLSHFVFSSQENNESFEEFKFFPIELQKIIWLHLAEKFLQAISQDTPVRSGSRRFSLRPASVELKNIDNKKEVEHLVAEILECLFLFYNGDKKYQKSSQMKDVLRLLGNIFDSPEKTNLFIGSNFDSREELGSTIRNICFAGKCPMLLDESFNDSNQNSFITDSNIDAIFYQLDAGLAVVNDKLAIKNDQLVPYLMEPLLASFIMIYNYLFNSPNKEIKNIRLKWLAYSGKIKNIGREISVKGRYYSFAKSWENFIKIIFDKNTTENERSSDSIRKEKLYADLYWISLVHHHYDQLECEFLEPWLEQMRNNLRGENKWVFNSGVKEALLFILKPLDSNSVPSSDEKRDALLGFFLHGVKEIQFLNGVLCVSVADNYDTYWSKHFPFKTLDGVAYSLKEMYKARWDQWKSNKSLPTPFDYPVVFVYEKGKTVWCREVRESNGEIIRSPEPCLAKDSYLLARAKSQLLTNESQNNSQLEKFILESSFKPSAIVELKFFNILLTLIHDATALIKRSPGNESAEFTITRKFNFSVAHDNPAELINLNETELVGIFLLGILYQILSTKEMEVTRVYWVNNLPSAFFLKDENVSALAQKSFIKSGMFAGLDGEKGGLRKKLETIDSRLQAETARGINKWQMYRALYSDYKHDVAAAPEMLSQKSSKNSLATP